MTLTRRALLAAAVLAPAAAALAQEPAGDVEVLQAVLRIEHATIHGYGAVGPRLPQPARDLARRVADVHRLQRDLLRAAIAERGGTPEPAELAYARPAPETLPRAAVERVELTALSAYHAALPRLGQPALRGLAAQLLARSAETLTELTGRASALPGR